MLNLTSIMIGTARVKELAAFYEKILGRKADMEDDAYYGWKVGNGFLMIGEHSEVKGEAKEPQRMMLNLEIEEVQDEFDRMKELGATVIKEPYDMGGGMIATLADPDGNYFQLMTPWDDDDLSVN